jgi:cation transport protein ChaC
MSDTPNAPRFLVPPLSDAARADSLRNTLAAAPSRSDIWVFAYGSLIWNPCFTATARRTVTLPTHRRAFNVWSMLARGTPERPGLGLGLEPGGTCTGLAYRLDSASLQEDLATLWAREMHSGIYVPEWLTVSTDNSPITTLCFVADPAHPQYAGALPDGDVAAVIAAAEGKFGSCRDYLASTVHALDAHGFADDVLRSMLDRVEALSTTDKNAS